MRTIKAESGQSLEDIAIQRYGCIEGLITLLEDNRLGLDADLYPGQPLLIQDEVPELTPTNRAVAAHFATQSISPNAAVPPGSADVEYVEIDYWIDDYAE